MDLFLGDFPLKDIHDVLLGSVPNFLGKPDDLVLYVDESPDVLADLGDPHGVDADDFGADGLDFEVGLGSDLVDEIPDGQLGRLGKDVQNVLALHEAGSLDGLHYVEVRAAGLEPLVLLLLAGLLENHDSVVLDQVSQKVLLLVFEQRPSLVFELDHLVDLLVVVPDGEIPFCSVDDHDHSFLDVLKSLERL